MARNVFRLWFVSAFLMAFSFVVKAQEIRIESALVAVPTVVGDAKGRFIFGLNADAFKLFHDGEQEKISLFLTSDDPCKIALLLDTSKTTASVLKKIKKAAKRFLLQMRPRDMAMIVSFDSEVRILCRFSSDRHELEDAIDQAEPGGMHTRLRDAIFDVQNRFRSISGRKAMVLLTDGNDRGSAISAPELRDVVLSSGALIYSVFYNIDWRQLMKELFGSAPPKNKRMDSDWAEQERESAEYLREISELSAGRLYSSKVTELDRAFNQIANELHAQYLLCFYPDESKLDGNLHSLTVQVNVPGAVVRNRRNYRKIANDELRMTN